MGRHETDTGRIVTREYPHSTEHGLGLPNLIEMMQADATSNDLDDQNRLLAGALLLGLNLGQKRNAQGLDLTLAFRERDL